MTNPHLFSPTHLWLQLSPTERQTLWQSDAYPTAFDRWNAYLNNLCLHALLPWFQDLELVKPWPAQTRPAVWSVVNGTALEVGERRYVILPMEAIDWSELRVPQEWVDLPSWAADYYLAAQVEPEEGTIQVWGYASHAMVKTQGDYDSDDRTYVLSDQVLMTDIGLLQANRALESETRVALAPIPALSLPQAENLLQRLAAPDQLMPRLAVPFPLWGGLMEHGGWRQRLYERRLGLTEPRSLSQWLQSGLSELAQNWGWQQITWQTAGATARGEEVAAATPLFARRLRIAGQDYELRIIPQGDPEARTWRFALENIAPAGLVPGGFVLRLLSEDFQPFAGNEDRATTAVDRLYVDVALAVGEGIVWEIEPLPEEYDQEILRF